MAANIGTLEPFNSLPLHYPNSSSLENSAPPNPRNWFPISGHRTKHNQLKVGTRVNFTAKQP